MDNKTIHEEVQDLFSQQEPKLDRHSTNGAGNALHTELDYEGYNTPTITPNDRQ